MVNFGQSNSHQIRSNLKFLANFGQRWLNMVNQLSEIVDLGVAGSIPVAHP